MNVKANITLAVIYSIVISWLGLWWADNFNAHTHFKGDEIFFEIEFVGILTIVASLCSRIINKKLSWKFILFTPVLAGLCSIIITTILGIVSPWGGTTIECLRLYGFVHSAVIIIMFYIRLRSTKSQTLNH